MTQHRPTGPVARAILDTVDPAAHVVMREDGLEIRRRCRPKALRYQILTGLWLVPSAGALVILAIDWPAWSSLHGLGPRLGAVPLQSWIAAANLLFHSWCFGMWRHHRRHEPWIERTFLEPDMTSAPTPPTPTVP